jgi:mannose-6-phosphate isomerase-like protein (cupin superfamily)
MLVMKGRRKTQMSHNFTVVGAETIDLDEIANQLRKEIDALPAGSPPDKLLAAKFLNQQRGVQAYLVVVRGNEDPHTHPDGDLIIYVLEGGGEVHLSPEIVAAPSGSTVVIPKGVCHAYYNTSAKDSIILATFSPINSRSECPLIF